MVEPVGSRKNTAALNYILVSSWPATYSDLFIIYVICSDDLSKEGATAF